MRPCYAICPILTKDDTTFLLSRNKTSIMEYLPRVSDRTDIDIERRNHHKAVCQRILIKLSGTDKISSGIDDHNDIKKRLDATERLVILIELCRHL